MSIINKKRLKEEFKKNNLKIGNNALKKFIKLLEENIFKEIELKVREIRIKGRKVVE